MAAAALQTANRFLNMRLPRTRVNAQPAWSTSAATLYYRGSAIIHTLTGANNYNGAGSSTVMPLASATYAVFAGVNNKYLSVPADAGTTFATGPDINQYGLEVITSGIVEFDFESATSTTYDATYVGQTFWFHSDHEVGYYPPAGTYPIAAGRLVELSGTKALIDITGYTFKRPIANLLSVPIPAALFALAASSAIPTDPTDADQRVILAAAAGTADRFTLARRYWLNRALITTTAAFTASTTPVVGVGKGAATMALTSCAVSLTLGETKTTALGIAMGVTDNLAVYTGNTDADTNIAAGTCTLTLEWFDLDQ